MTADAHSIISIVFGACDCKDTFDCSSSLDSNGGIILWLAIMLYMFKALGTICDEYFVPSLEMISEKLELSNDVAGATFMAAGSSAPELFTSLVATFLIVNEGGVGTIIGSAIFNILVIVGATCCFAGQELTIWWYPLARDVSFYIISIIELSLVLTDSEVMWWEGLIMFLTYIGYILFMKQNHRIVARLGGEPGSIVKEVEDPEMPSPEPETAEKSEKSEKPEKPEEGDGPRAAAMAEPEVAPQPEPLEEMPKGQAQSGNPNTPDDAEEEGSKDASKLQESDPQAKADTTVKPAEDPEAPAPEVAVASAPGAPDITSGAGAAAPHVDSEGKHHVWMSMHELHDHKGHDKDGNGGEDFTASGSAKVAAASTDPAKGGEPEKVEETDTEEPPGRTLDPLNKIWELVMPTPERYWLLFAASIANIAGATYVMVDAVNRTGCNLNIQPLIMGLIFLAAGTSVPDALGSIAVAKQGEGDMAVANAFGSNVFDILLGLGVPWFLSTAVMGKQVAFPGAGAQLLEWVLILAAILIAFVAALAYNRMRLNQMMGAILMTLYLVYVVVALVRAFAFK